MDYENVLNLLKNLGCEEKEAEARAEYIEQCCDEYWNVEDWYYNSEGKYFDNENEALEFIEDEVLTIEEDCNIYIARNGGVWFEYY